MATRPACLVIGTHCVLTFPLVFLWGCCKVIWGSLFTEAGKLKGEAVLHS